MGVYFSWPTRTDLVQSLIRSAHDNNILFETLEYTLCGNVLWSLVQLTALHDSPERPAGHSTTLICYDLLLLSDGQWGHSSLTEADEPHDYTCPLSWLSLAPVRSPVWRERVMAYHQSRRESV